MQAEKPKWFQLQQSLALLHGMSLRLLLRGV